MEKIIVSVMIKN